MLVIALTGGIGSGKSTVAQFFAEEGVPIIDADLLAREVILDQSLDTKIQQFFGDSIRDANGQIQRSKLRELIFNNPQQKAWLEDLLHPLIIEAIKNQLHQLNAPYCLVVIPLLIETGPYSFIDRILVVDAPEEDCIKRAQLRDKLDQEAVLKIMQTQSKRETRLAAANEVIENRGGLEDIKEQVKQLHQIYSRLAQKNRG